MIFIKKVKKNELEILIRECFTKNIDAPELDKATFKLVSLTINSIYAIIDYKFHYDKTNKDFIIKKFIEKFENELKKYVGENLKVYNEIGNKIIIKIDYEIIDN